MKKLDFTAIVAILSLVYSETKAQDFDYINAGIGLSGWGIPLVIGGDYTIDQDLIPLPMTVGVQLSGQRKTERYSVLGDTYRWTHTVIGVSGNANVHFVEASEPFDVYAGASLGWYFWNTKNSGNSPVVYSGGGSGGFGVRLQVGGRYHLNNGMSLWGELGGGNVISSAVVGVSFPMDFDF